ncbi:LysR family transcriptional regulator [Terriglobus saanensis]|uniref:LysR family transcriptional regulator n=1 Tax=Terriglobus saanensis TaxID=870903 RepID=UPI000304EBB4|nr:LysR family transcriptional regulator [Terriglobus saanensis]
MHYFKAVAESGGFGKAARLLNVSQSAVSEQVRDLEAEIAVPLIDRSNRNIRLTPHGEVFLTRVKEVLQLADGAVTAARRSFRGEEGSLSIGFFVGGIGSSFPKLIHAFRQKYKDIAVSLVEMTPVAQHDALVAGSIDIAFTRALPGTLKAELRSEIFYTERLSLVLPKGHPLAERASISVQELRAERFVINDRKNSPAVFDKIIALCDEAGFSPNIIATASVSSGVIALVESGEGIALLPKGSQLLGSSELVFVPVQDAAASVDLVVAWSAKHERKIHQSFLSLARQFRM